MNVVVLKGNLTRDPEIREVGQKGSKVVNFSIAINRYFKKSNGDKGNETTYLDCEAWDSGAETIERLFSKGDPILINGSLKQDTWEQDGQKRSKLKVRVSGFEKLNKYQGDDSRSNESDDQAPAPPAGDDVPF